MDKNEFERIIQADKESEKLEFKEAKTNYSFESGNRSICGYVVALANEGGGKLIFGVTDKIPRIVVGTSAFPNLGKLKKQIFEKLHRRVDIEEFEYRGKRVLIFHIPSRPIGQAIEFCGKFLMRVDDSIVPMTPEHLAKINKEYIQDFSAEIAVGATIKDLNEKTILLLRKFLRDSKRVDKDITRYSDEQLLIDLGLIRDSKITNAALILLGNEESLKKFFPHAEVRYQYKEDETKVRNDSFEIFQGGYLGYYGSLWKYIDNRNTSTLLQVGFRALQKKTFNEETIREAINNAIIHRDYSEMGSIIITQTPKKIKVESPGGLLPGLTIENIVDETKVRNKLLAEVLSKCGFVESFGNGVDLIIQNQLGSGKKHPDYSDTSKYKVVLDLDGKIHDRAFASYVAKIAIEENKELSYKELMILMQIKIGRNISSNALTDNLLALKLIERIGAKKYILSKKYYDGVGKRGEYTRRKGLDKRRNQELILEHLRIHKTGYMEEFMDIFNDDIKRTTISNWLSELKKDGRIVFKGHPQAVRGEERGHWTLVK